MRYIDRRFLIPVAAATAWAQQPSPAAAEAEAALRARAEQFFQLQVDKKFRQAEALVAEDTKDAYYNGNKFNIKSFTLQTTELLDNNTRARVTVKTKVTRIVAGFPPMDFDAPATTLWKLENGQWVWYIDQGAAVRSPFGTLQAGKGTGSPSSLNIGRAPDLSTLRSSVKIDRNSVELIPDGPVQTVAVSNELPGGVDLELRPDRITGLSVQLGKKHLEAGEKTTIYFRASTGGEGAGIVRLMVSPIVVQLDIRVKVNN
jgi:hypothetical protein